MNRNIESIVAQYDLPETSPILPLRESSDNLVFLIGQKDKRILRISKKLRVSDIAFEKDLLGYLAEKGIPVPRWIQTKDEKDYGTGDSGEPCIMFSFLEGQHIKVDKTHLPTIPQAVAVGKVLGKLANIGRGFMSRHKRSRDIVVELKRVLENRAIFYREYEGGETFVKEVESAIAFASADKSTQGIVHNDLRSHNVFFKGDDLVGIVDFDWAFIGPIIKDLAHTVLEWSFPDGADGYDKTIFSAIVDGYNSEAVEKIEVGPSLYKWICFSALADTATFFCDRIGTPNARKRITGSYMYLKYLAFKKFL